MAQKALVLLRRWTASDFLSGFFFFFLITVPQLFPFSQGNSSKTHALSCLTASAHRVLVRGLFSPSHAFAHVRPTHLPQFSLIYVPLGEPSLTCSFPKCSQPVNQFSESLYSSWPVLCTIIIIWLLLICLVCLFKLSILINNNLSKLSRQGSCLCLLLYLQYLAMY